MRSIGVRTVSRRLSLVGVLFWMGQEEGCYALVSSTDPTVTQSRFRRATTRLKEFLWIRPKKTDKRPLGTVFRLRFPTRDNLVDWFGAQVDIAQDDEGLFNHGMVGMSKPPKEEANGREHDTLQCESLEWWPSISGLPDASWRRIRLRKTIGTGKDVYQTCRQAALQWEFQSNTKGLLQIWNGTATSSNPALPLTPGRKLATYTTLGTPLSFLPKLHTINPVTVVYNVLDQRSLGPDCTFTSTAYATGCGHLLRGEERVSVIHRHNDNKVDIEILSFSRPAATWKGKLVWPFVGGMQRAFFVQELDWFQQVANGGVDM